MSTGAFHEGINFAAVQRLPAGRHRARTTATPIRTPHREADGGGPAGGQGRRLRRARRSAPTATTCWTSTGSPRRRWSGRAAGQGLHPDRADHLPAEGARGARQPVVRAAGRDRRSGKDEGPDRSLRAPAPRRPAGLTPRSSRRIDARVAAELDAATTWRSSRRARAAMRRAACTTAARCRRSGIARTSAARRAASGTGGWGLNG